MHADQALTARIEFLEARDLLVQRMEVSLASNVHQVTSLTREARLLDASMSSGSLLCCSWRLETARPRASANS